MKKIIYSICLALSINACSVFEKNSNEPKECQDQKAFIGKTYQMVSENSTPVIIKFNKENRTINGQVVNRFFAEYSLGCNEIYFDKVGSTKMMGPPDAMKAEDEFLINLNNTISYHINGDELVLMYKIYKDYDEETKAIVFKEIKNM